MESELDAYNEAIFEANVEAAIEADTESEIKAKIEHDALLDAPTKDEVTQWELQINEDFWEENP